MQALFLILLLLLVAGIPASRGAGAGLESNGLIVVLALRGSSANGQFGLMRGAIDGRLVSEIHDLEGRDGLRRLKDERKWMIARCRFRSREGREEKA